MQGPIAEQRWILTATVLGTSMAFIDGSVINRPSGNSEVAFGDPGAGRASRRDRRSGRNAAPACAGECARRSDAHRSAGCGAQAEPPKNLDAATRGRIRAAIELSFLRAFRVNMFAASTLAAVSAFAALGIKRGNVRLL